jgi:hypothetical protein
VRNYIVDLEEYRRIMEKLGEGFEEFKKRHTDELTKEREHREALERKLNLAKVNGDPTAAIEKPEAWLDVKTRRPVPVLQPRAGCERAARRVQGACHRSRPRRRLHGPDRAFGGLD